MSKDEQWLKTHDNLAKCVQVLQSMINSDLPLWNKELEMRSFMKDFNQYFFTKPLSISIFLFIMKYYNANKGFEAIVSLAKKKLILQKPYQ